MQHAPEYKRKFRVNWGTHNCDVVGCGTWLICDGGMKPHHIVCAARYSGIRSYKHTNIKTVTGCTKKPSKDTKFCSEHEGKEGPVVLAENLSIGTKRALRKKQTNNYPQDNIFFVRALLKQDGDSYLVRWATLPVEEATWEPKASLPAFIVEWYGEDPKRLGKDIPQPRIKWSKVTPNYSCVHFLYPFISQNVGKGEKFYFLSWGKGGTLVEQEELKESIFDMDLDTLIPESSCNTRKVRIHMYISNLISMLSTLLGKR